MLIFLSECVSVHDRLTKRNRIEACNLVHTIPMSISENVFFFSKKITIRAADIEKLPCHVHNQFCILIDTLARKKKTKNISCFAFNNPTFLSFVHPLFYQICEKSVLLIFLRCTIFKSWHLLLITMEIIASPTPRTKEGG